eukprot:6196174-Pleurochrysis_carterae.AAC.1
MLLKLLRTFKARASTTTASQKAALLSTCKIQRTAKIGHGRKAETVVMLAEAAHKLEALPRCEASQRLVQKKGQDIATAATLKKGRLQETKCSHTEVNLWQRRDTRKRHGEQVCKKRLWPACSCADERTSHLNNCQHKNAGVSRATLSKLYNDPMT